MVVSRKAFLSGLLGATLVLSAPQSADSFELNPKAVLGIDAEVGLDPETRALLGRLPEELRAEIVKAVNESFDRADKSVVLFMSELNKTVGVAIDDAACKAAAAANNVAQAFAGKIPLLGGKQTIVKDAFADFEATQEAASAGDKPTDYSIAYADLLARTVVSRCIVSQSAEAVAELDKLQAAVRPKWSVWTRLGKAECEDAQSCFAMLENKTREVVTEAGPRRCRRCRR